MPDWAAPAIQFCRALEYELRRRLYEPQANCYELPKVGFTLGTIPFAYSNRKHNSTAWMNWNLFGSLITRSKSSMEEFEYFLNRMLDSRIYQQRNELAHGEPITKEAASAIRDCVIGDSDQPGILCWLAKQVDAS